MLVKAVWIIRNIKAVEVGVNVRSRMKPPAVSYNGTTGGELMKRYFWLISTVSIFVCGLVLHIAYEESGRAAWSILISSVNASPWEMTKPFVLIYIFWVFIELSCLRPSLLRFVCAKLAAMYLFAGASVTGIYFVGIAGLPEWAVFAIIFISLLAAQRISYGIYRCGIRIDLFWTVLLLSLGLMLAMILFCSLYPPHFPVFMDRHYHTYGMIPLT